MSPSGALIEAPYLPLPGSRIFLKRGSLQVGGRIAWRVNSRAGMAFDNMVCAADWMARMASSGQDRVDEIVAGIKAGSGRHPVQADTSDIPGTATIEAELATVKADLVALSESLIGDTIVAATHPEIQTLDITLQRIDRILLKLEQGA